LHQLALGKKWNRFRLIDEIYTEEMFSMHSLPNTTHRKPKENPLDIINCNRSNICQKADRIEKYAVKSSTKIHEDKRLACH
jgi:hypothetical protein